MPTKQYKDLECPGCNIAKRVKDRVCLLCGDTGKFSLTVHDPFNCLEELDKLIKDGE